MMFFEVFAGFVAVSLFFSQSLRHAVLLGCCLQQDLPLIGNLLYIMEETCLKRKQICNLCSIIKAGRELFCGNTDISK